MEKAVIQLSGGFDSVSLSAIYTSRGVELYPITFKYGQTNEEFESAIRFANLLGMQDRHIIVDIYSEDKLELEFHLSKFEAPMTFITTQFIMFTQISGAYAKMIGAQDVITASNFRFNYAEMKSPITVGGTEINFLYPYLDEFEDNKALLGYSALDTGLITAEELATTVSCRKTVNGVSCGVCGYCTFRKEFFKPLGTF